MKKGYIYSIVSAILFGSAGLIVKLAFIEGAESINLLTLQYMIAIPIMFMVLLLTNRAKFKVCRKELYHLLVLGAVGNSLMTVFYYKAYSYLPMSMVTILLYTYPIIVFLYSIIFRKEKIGTGKTMALLLAFVGCILALGLAKGELSYSPIGIVFGLLSAMFYAFMNIYSENNLQEVESLTINAYSTLFSLLCLTIYKFPVFLLQGEISLKLLGYTVILAVFCEIIPLTLMYAAIKHIGSLKVSIIGNIETPTAMLLSVILLKEHISFIQILGAALVFYAVYLIRK